MTAAASKLPKQILPDVWAFPPNRDTLGGTAYLLATPSGNIAIDACAWNDVDRTFIQDCGGLDRTIVTHRGGIGSAAAIVAATGCQLLIHEREAYLLPDTPTIAFQEEYRLDDETQIIWTPGHSPGSSCVYTSRHGGILFTGRHLLPDGNGNIAPLQLAKTFHWQRQQRSVIKLADRLASLPLAYICPGANTGLLRGEGIMSAGKSLLEAAGRSIAAS
jgi:glyoxylase-like metal-dependent hydrolase (beta-lactamase superfamily II)